MPRALVLGGTGFIGSHLVVALLSQGFDVRSFSRHRDGLLPLEALSHPALEQQLGSLNNRQSLALALRDVDIIFHLACSTLPQSSNADPLADLHKNLIGTVTLLEEMRLVDAVRLVFVSSGGTVYGVPRQVPIPESHPTDPICAYGISKLAAEKYLALYRSQHGLDGVVLRVANPYGERQRLNAPQGVVPVFLGQALQGQAIKVWGDGSTVRDFLHVSDVVAALLAAARYQGREHLFNIGSGLGCSLNQLIAGLEGILRRPIQRCYMPAREFDVPTNVLAIDRAVAELGWQPRVDLEQGLLSTLAALIEPGAS